ncbi:MAG: class I SAM-dependent methyltransferase [Lacisediminihabitans sp.]
MTESTTPAEFWEARYADSDRVWSGRVNQALADVAVSLTPGSALDLGCGEGGDAVWLAQRGWRVTGVDLSATAVARGTAAASAAGLSADRIELIAADLATWDSDNLYDLVTASFLHSWPALIPREEILRRATRFVAPDGLLLVVAHAAAPPWASPDMIEANRFPSPQGDLATLELDPARWTVLTVETRERAATGPDAQPATLLDGIVLVRRDA